MIFKVPDENLDDFNRLLQGKYSEVSQKTKTLIMQNNFFSGKPYVIPLILNKAKNLKDSWEKRLSNDGIINGVDTGIRSMADLRDQQVWPIYIKE